MSDKRILSLAQLECGCRQVRLYQPSKDEHAAHEAVFYVKTAGDLGMRVDRGCGECSPAVDWSIDAEQALGEPGRLDQDFELLALKGLKLLAEDLCVGVDADGAGYCRTWGGWRFRVHVRDRAKGLDLGVPVESLRRALPYLAGVFDVARELHRRINNPR